MDNTHNTINKHNKQPDLHNTIKVPINDHCTQCPWLDKQPSGNRMLCVLPGECFWLDGWRDNGAIKQTR